MSNYDNYPSSLYPFLSEGSFRSICHYIYDDYHTLQPSEVQRANSIIYIKNELRYIENFFKNIIPRITHNVIIITCGTIPSYPGQFRKCLEHPKLIAWFAKNNTLFGHPKMHSLPLGCLNRYQENHLDIVKKNYMTDPQKIMHDMFHKEKSETYFVNFNKCAYRDRSRYKAEEVLQKYGYPNLSFTNMQNYMENVKSHKFVISPLGSGYDCYRHWESMYMGTIPITTSSPIDMQFKNLPIIILNSWDDFTPEKIVREYNKLYDNRDKIEWEKLFCPYWFNKIHECQTIGMDNPTKYL